LCADGVHVADMTVNDSVTIKKSAHCVPFIRFGQTPFYPRLRQKLGGTT